MNGLTSEDQIISNISSVFFFFASFMLFYRNHNNKYEYEILKVNIINGKFEKLLGLIFKEFILLTFCKYIFASSGLITNLASGGISALALRTIRFFLDKKYFFNICDVILT